MNDQPDDFSLIEKVLVVATVVSSLAYVAVCLAGLFTVYTGL